MNTDNYHELRCKLFCFTTEATPVTNKLLEHFSLNCHLVPKTETNPNKALADVLKYYHTNNNFALNALKSPQNKIKIFTSIKGKKTVKNEVEIDSFDLTLSTNILLNTDVFPSCEEAHRLHLECKHCGITNDKRSVVCCIQCLCCNNCRTSGPIPCESSTIRESVNLVRILRNRTSHLSDIDCKKIEQETANGSTKWDQDVNSYIGAVKTLIDYLEVRRLINDAKKIKTNLDFVLYNTKDIYMRIFSETVNKTLNIVKTCDETLDISFCCTSPNSHLSSIKRIHSQESKIVTSTFLLQVEEKLENELNWNSPGAFVVQMKGINHIQEVAAKKSLNSIVRVHITSNEKEFPECYKDMYSIESLQFQNQLEGVLETIIQNVLKIDVKAESNGWMFKSIHVDITISSTERNGEKWTSKQIQLINSTLETAITKHQPLIREFLSVFEMEDCDISTSFPTCNSYTTYELLIKCSDKMLYNEIKRVLPSFRHKLTQTLHGKGNDKMLRNDTTLEMEKTKLVATAASREEETALSEKNKNLEVFTTNQTLEDISSCEEIALHRKGHLVTSVSIYSDSNAIKETISEKVKNIPNSIKQSLHINGDVMSDLHLVDGYYLNQPSQSFSQTFKEGLQDAKRKAVIRAKEVANYISPMQSNLEASSHILNSESDYVMPNELIEVRNQYILPLEGIISKICTTFAESESNESYKIGDDSFNPSMGWLVRSNMCTIIASFISIGLKQNLVAKTFFKSKLMSLWSLVKNMSLSFKVREFDLLIHDIENSPVLHNDNMRFRQFFCEMLNRSNDNGKEKLIISWFQQFPLSTHTAKFYVENSFWRISYNMMFCVLSEEIVVSLKLLNGLPFNLKMNFELNQQNLLKH